MKKITFLTIAFVTLGMVSCKKDRTCTCSSSSTSVRTNSGSNTSTLLNVTVKDDKTDTYTILKATKSVARPRCLSSKKTETFKTAEGTTFEMTEVKTFDGTCKLK